MHLVHRALAVLVCFAGTTAAGVPDAGSDGLRVMDAAQSCGEFWRRVANATPEQQARAFEELLRAPHPTLYTTAVLGLDEPLAKSVPERVPDTLLAQATPRLAELAGRLLGHLDDPADGPVYRQFFYGSTEKAPEVPPRSGYVLGWRIAEAAGKTRSLAQLAAMSPVESRALVERELRRLSQTGGGEPRHESTEKTSSERRTSKTK